MTDEDLAPLFEPKEAAKPAVDEIDITAFRQADLRVGRILSAERIEKSKKLLKLQVEVGAEKRQILAGIAEAYAPEELVGKLVIAIVNLKPAKLMGHQSEGMLLAAGGKDGKPILLTPEKAAESGAKVS